MLTLAVLDEFTLAGRCVINAADSALVGPVVFNYTKNESNSCVVTRSLYCPSFQWGGEDGLATPRRRVCSTAVYCFGRNSPANIDDFPAAAIWKRETAVPQNPD